MYSLIPESEILASKDGSTTKIENEEKMMLLIEIQRGSSAS